MKVKYFIEFFGNKNFFDVVVDKNYPSKLHYIKKIIIEIKKYSISIHKNLITIIENFVINRKIMN